MYLFIGIFTVWGNCQPHKASVQRNMQQRIILQSPQWWSWACARVLARFSSVRTGHADRREFCWGLNASCLTVQKRSGLELHKLTFGESTVVRAGFFTRTICFGLISACSTLLQILVLIYILHVFVCLLKWNCFLFWFGCFFLMNVFNLAIRSSRQNHTVIQKKTNWFIYSKSEFF